MLEALREKIARHKADIEAGVENATMAPADAEGYVKAPVQSPIPP